MKLSRLSMLWPILAIAAMALCLSYSVNADEPKSDVSAKAKPAAPVNPRVAVIARITKSALQTMAKSNDPVALVLSAKYVRDADLKPGEERTEVQKNYLQLAALTRAKKLSTHKNSGLVDFQIAMFCIGLPKEPICDGKDTLELFAQREPTTSVGWVVLAGREFAQGRNPNAQTYLQKAAKAKKSVWFYKEGGAVALKYAKAVKGVDIKPGDAEAAAFDLMGGMTLPTYKRLSQMCMPDPESKLPEGRYPVCRQIAQLLIDDSETNLEVLVGYSVLERLAIGEKKDEQAKSALAQYNTLQTANDFLWKTVLKFPPQTDADGSGLVLYFADLASQGEVSATRLALKRAGKSIADFKPSASTPEK